MCVRRNLFVFLCVCLCMVCILLFLRVRVGVCVTLSRGLFCEFSPIEVSSTRRIVLHRRVFAGLSASDRRVLFFCFFFHRVGVGSEPAIYIFGLGARFFFNVVFLDECGRRRRYPQPKWAPLGVYVRTLPLSLPGAFRERMHYYTK